MRPVFLKYLTPFLIVFPLPSVAASDLLGAPYATANRNPFVQIYGLPSAQSAQLQMNGKIKIAMQHEAASNFTFDGALTDTPSDQPVILDGETHRTNLQWRYGYDEDWEIGIDIPYLRHKAGGLDSFINDWHDTFSLPDGNRTDFLDDQLLFFYQDGADVFSLDRDNAGIGDVSLSAAYRLSSHSTRQTALRFGIKLATGDAKKLHGSEATDAFVSWHISDQYTQRFIWHASAGLLLLGDGEVLDGVRNDAVVFGSTTVSYTVRDNVSLKAQLDAQSAFYNSSTTELGSASMQLTIGGAIAFGRNFSLDLSISEDIAVDTAPDVVFQLGFNYYGL